MGNVPILFCLAHCRSLQRTVRELGENGFSHINTRVLILFLLLRLYYEFTLKCAICNTHKCTKMRKCFVLSLFLHATLLKHLTYWTWQKYLQNSCGFSYNPCTSLSLVQGYKGDIPTGLLQVFKSENCNLQRT